jgi:hypothetical protein
VGFSKPKWYGSSFVNGEDEPLGSLALWNMACPPQSEHDRRAISTITKFRELDDVVATSSVIEMLRSPKFDNWQWEDHEVRQQEDVVYEHLIHVH